MITQYLATFLISLVYQKRLCHDTWLQIIITFLQVKTLDNSRLHTFSKINILYKGDERLKYMISGISGEHNPKNDD